jgi:hypothetical protein
MAVASVPVVGTANTISTGMKVRSTYQSFRNIPQIVPETARLMDLNDAFYPLLTLLGKTGRTKEVGATSFYHMEDDQAPTFVTTAANITVGTGSKTFATAAGHGPRCRVGTILIHPATRQQYVVTSVNANGAELTVETGQGGSATGTQVDSGDKLQIMAGTATDGGGAGDGISMEPAQKLNYMQIHRTPFSISRRAKNGAIYGPDELARMKEGFLVQHLQEIEKILLFGGLDAGGTGNRRMETGGVENWVTSLVETISGDLTEQTFNNWVKATKYYNQSAKMVYVFGEYLIDHLNGWAADRVQQRPEDNVGGITINTWKSAAGECKFINHGMLTAAYEDGLTWAGRGYALNMDFLKLALYKNSKFAKLTRIGSSESDGTDGEKWEYLTDFGVWVGPERRHGIIKSVPALT